MYPLSLKTPAHFTGASLLVALHLATSECILVLIVGFVFCFVFCWFFFLQATIVNCNVRLGQDESAQSELQFMMYF